MGIGSRVVPSNERSKRASSLMDPNIDAVSPSSIHTLYMSSPNSNKSSSRTIFFLSYADLLSSTPTSTDPRLRSADTAIK